MKANRSERIGWYFYDWANSAFYTTVVTVFLGPYLTTITKNAADAEGFVHIFGMPIFHGSFYSYVVSISVLLQVIVLPIAGAIADYTNRKKLLLGIFAYTGSFSTMGLYFLQGDNYLLGGLLFILANISFGASVVIYNSFLNDIAAEDERDSVSSVGWAFGYLGGGIVLAANLFMYSSAEKLGIDSGMAVRISLCSAGAWWGLFTLMPMLTLKTRQNIRHITEEKKLLSIGFTQFFRTLKGAAKYPQTLLFLLAYLLYNDGVQTVIVVSSQFGSEELGLDMSVLTTVILMVQFVAFGGSLIFNYLAKVFNTKKAIIISILIWMAALLYAFGFLHDQTGFYILGGVIGLVLGGIQALSRSLFSRLIPPGKEAEYFGVYEISERGTSWIGPLLFGLTLQLSGSYRLAILSLVLFFAFGLFFLIKLNVNKGVKEAAGDGGEE